MPMYNSTESQIAALLHLLGPEVLLSELALAFHREAKNSAPFEANYAKRLNSMGDTLLQLALDEHRAVLNSIK
jgi:hypothetical protein